VPALASNRTSLVGLRRIEILSGLEPAVIEALAARLNWHRARADERIISRDAADRDVYLVVGGRVQVAAFSAGGKQVTYKEIGAGELFGELAAIDGRVRSADVIALEDSLLASMSPSVFLEMMFAHRIVAEHVLRRLAGSVREMTERVFQLSTLGVRNRVHAELLRLARLGAVTGNQARIAPAPRHGDIANRVSTYREQVTRELSRLYSQGLLARDGRCLVVCNLYELERMVTEVGQAA
jgi:CRP/FNR family cyclic AMP-dependent transcriptional regulator